MPSILASINLVIIIMCVGYDLDIRDSIADIAMFARHVLQLPSETIVTTSSLEPREPGLSGLVIGLVVAAAVMILILIVVTAYVIWSNLCRTKR